jgi:hypothetical protein
MGDGEWEMEGGPRWMRERDYGNVVEGRWTEYGMENKPSDEYIVISKILNILPLSSVIPATT